MTAQPPHNNRPDKPEGIKKVRKYLGLPENDPDNQADWLMDLLEEIQGYIDDDKIKLAARIKAHQAITTKIAEERKQELVGVVWNDTLPDAVKDALVPYIKDRVAELEAGLSQAQVSDLASTDPADSTDGSNPPKSAGLKGDK